MRILPIITICILATSNGFAADDSDFFPMDFGQIKLGIKYVPNKFRIGQDTVLIKYLAGLELNDAVVIVKTRLGISQKLNAVKAIELTSLKPGTELKFNFDGAESVRKNEVHFRILSREGNVKVGLRNEMSPLWYNYFNDEYNWVTIPYVDLPQ